MATGTYSPDPAFTMFDDSGNIVPGGLLETYLAGTSTPATTYSNVGLTVANANPVVMDAAGRATIFLTPGVSYKYIAKTAASVTLWTRDNIATVPPFTQDTDISATAGETVTANDFVYFTSGTGGDAARTAGRFYKTDQTFSYRSSTPSIIGVVLANASAGSTVSVRVAGKVTGLSGLSVGSLYWLSTTPGAVTSTSQATVAGRSVGFADSTTTLILFPAQCPPIVATHATDGTGTYGMFLGGVNLPDPPQWSPGTTAAGAATSYGVGVMDRQTTATSVVDGTAGADLMTFTVPANTLAVDGQMLRVTMLVANSGGGAGNRTYACFLDTDNIATAALATNGTQARFEFEIIRTGAATQIASLKRIVAAGVAWSYVTTFTRDLTAALVLKLRFTGVGVTDGATQNLMLTETVG